jgi:hypothetical protein
MHRFSLFLSKIHGGQAATKQSYPYLHRKPFSSRALQTAPSHRLWRFGQCSIFSFSLQQKRHKVQAVSKLVREFSIPNLPRVLTIWDGRLFDSFVLIFKKPGQKYNEITYYTETACIVINKVLPTFIQESISEEVKFLLY